MNILIHSSDPCDEGISCLLQMAGLSAETNTDRATRRRSVAR